MRGSGCSGGAFDLFDCPTTYDGYDAVETVAAQSWVKGGKVGMGGISFSGITQLFTAGTRPPHLAAIAPMSVTDDIYTGTGYPGGIFNSGFAQSWILERMDDAKPAPAGGQPWARELVEGGRQALHAPTRAAAPDPGRAQAAAGEPVPHAVAVRPPRAGRVAEARATCRSSWSASSRTSRRAATSREALKYLNGKPNVYISVQNGVHADSLGPSTITRWAEFLKLYVADEIPVIPGSVHRRSAARSTATWRTPAAPVLQSRFATTTERRRGQGRLQEGPARAAC